MSPVHVLRFLKHLLPKILWWLLFLLPDLRTKQNFKIRACFTHRQVDWFHFTVSKNVYIYIDCCILSSLEWDFRSVNSYLMDPVLHSRLFIFLIFPIYGWHILHVQYQKPLIRLCFQTAGLHTGDQYIKKPKLSLQLCTLKACINDHIFFKSCNFVPHFTSSSMLKQIKLHGKVFLFLWLIFTMKAIKTITSSLIWQ